MELKALIERVKAATEWRQVPVWPYEASDTGVLRSMRSGKAISPTVTHNGYEKCTFQVDKRRKDVRVHRAVAEAWIGPIDVGMVVNHLDCDKRNNEPSNLEIVTPAENEAHAVLNGRKASGDRNGTRTTPSSVLRGSMQAASKLTEADIPKIRERCLGSESLAEIASNFGVSKQVIWQIKEGRTWTHV